MGRYNPTGWIFFPYTLKPLEAAFKQNKNQRQKPRKRRVWEACTPPASAIGRVQVETPLFLSFSLVRSLIVAWGLLVGRLLLAHPVRAKQLIELGIFSRVLCAVPAPRSSASTPPPQPARGAALLLQPSLPPLLMLLLSPRPSLSPHRPFRPFPPRVLSSTLSLSLCVSLPLWSLFCPVFYLCFEEDALEQLQTGSTKLLEGRVRSRIEAR